MARKADEKFEMTREEMERLHEAMKKEEFRKLLVEYAEEISNPENRKKYEEEIAMLESERGVDVKFVHPHPVYVLRTCADGARKAFINVAQNEAIERASLDRASGGGGARGAHWNIPHSFAPPREDRDKSGAKCSVFDVVFHPDTMRMAQSNAAFKRAIDNTALDGIERQFAVKLDRSNVKTMKKLKFKGQPTATVIRKTKENFPPAATKSDPDDPLGDLPYPYGAPGGGDGAPLLGDQKEEQKRTASTTSSSCTSSCDGYAVPKHTIVNQYHADMTDFATNLASPAAAGCSRPRALVVEVSLPLLSSAAGVTLDVLDRKLSLKSDAPARYKLDLVLPYPVDDANGSAKFDKRKKCLIVTLPVVPPKPQAPVDTLPLAVPAGCSDSGASHSTSSCSGDLLPNDGSCLPADVAQVGGCVQQGPAGDLKSNAAGKAAVSASCCHTLAAQTAAGDGGGVGERGDCNPADAARRCGAVDSSQDKAVGNDARDTPAVAAVSVEITRAASVADRDVLAVGSAERASVLAVSLSEEDATVASSSSGSANVSATDVPATKYVMPQFSYDQDDTRVTFVIEAKNIKADSVSIKFVADGQATAAESDERTGTDTTADCSNCFSVTFCSIGSGHFPMHYSLAVRFPSGCTIVGRNCDADVTVLNAVLIFRKANSSIGTWQNFECARTADELAAGSGETRSFATLENLQAELNRLEKECTEAKQLDSQAAGQAVAANGSLHVSSLRDECLSINIKELDSVRLESPSMRLAAVPSATAAARFRRDDDELVDDDDSALSSPEIIYNKEPPKDLQGILKKRSGSSSGSSTSDGPDEAVAGGASSDGGRGQSASGCPGGVSSDGGIESPDSSDDNSSSALSQRKKAVTFNDHVDETAYQPTAAVTMLHQTLKNKRKRQKKKEDRRHHAATAAEGRRRRRNSSSGSITTDEEEVVAAAMRESTTASGSQAAAGAMVRQKSSQNARSPRIVTSMAIPSLAADTATQNATDPGSSGDGSEQAVAMGTDSSKRPIESICSTPERAADLSKTTTGANDPPIGGGAEGSRVEIRERGTAGSNDPAGEGDAGREIAPDHRGNSRSPQIGQQVGSSVADERLRSLPPSAESDVQRCSAAAADSDDENDGADAVAQLPASAGNSAVALGGCRAAASLNEHATKCSFAFRNSLAYELD